MQELSISPTIVRDIARLTTLATPGVISLTDVNGLFGRVRARGVDVTINPDRSASISLHVVASADQSLKTLGAKIQSAVIEAVDEMTGLRVRRVDVSFEDVRSVA
jgi:uncharacterized alkaline shock family protein YloU